MNPKQAAPFVVTLAPAIATIAPPLIVVGLVGGFMYLVLNDLFPAKEKPPEIPPALPPAEVSQPAKPVAMASGFRPSPAAIPAKPASISVPPAPRVAAPPVVASQPIQPFAPAPAAAPLVQASGRATPPPVKKKFVTREDLAAVFQRGARSLNRTAAVAALKNSVLENQLLIRH